MEGGGLANGGGVSGASGSALNLANVSAADAAVYAVVITNLAGSVTRPPPMLTIAQTNPPGQLLLYEPFDYLNIDGPVLHAVTERGLALD